MPIGEKWHVNWKGSWQPAEITHEFGERIELQLTNAPPGVSDLQKTISTTRTEMTDTAQFKKI